MAKPVGPPSKLPLPVTATIRGPVGEFPAPVTDANPFGVELVSPRRLSLNERVGLTLRCEAVKGPGLSLSGDVRTCREESGPQYFVRVEFDHTGDSDKRLQTFLWDLEEAARKRRKR